MKKNMDSFAIYPLVVLEGQRTTVTVVSKMSCDGTESGIDYWGKQRSGGPFTTKKQYSVKVTPREIHYPETKAQKEIGYTVENGSLVFEYTFYGEQEYMVFIDEVVEGVNTRLTFFKLYSVKEDLYRLLPWKGELHMHSNWSDGKQPPEIMYSYARRAGMEFATLTDHYSLQPHPTILEKMSAIDSGLIIYPGEEVHKLGHKMHIVSIGASKCISRMLMDDYDNIKEEALKIAEKHTDLPEDVDPLEFGMQRWVFEQIKKLGGLSVLAHPYWPHEGNATYIPASLSRLIIEEGYSDAWEITGVDDGDKDFMQNVLYTEECEKGFRMPVVGATDAHDKSGLGDGYTIVFAEDANISSVTAAIKNHLSVGCRQYKRADGSMRYMAFGPTRLVRYAMFLMSEFYPLQDRLCFIEGELMNQVFSGQQWAAPLIGEVARHIRQEKRLCFGR
ncbi:MAG: PHP domain-containing protein [Clostridia bacterium]|jgi:hypothetical protein|nr:hypothetical protein [Clostridiaceae bacterium]